MSNEYKITKTNPEGTKTRWSVQRMSKSNQPIGKAEIFSTEEAAKRYVASKSEVKESRTSSILKGILSESGERVSVVYIDGKPNVKYTNIDDAKSAVDLMKKKHPKKNFEIKQEMRESAEERVSVVYIDGKPVIKYTNIDDAKEAVDVMKKNHPKKKYEIKQEMTEASNTMQRYGQLILKRAKAQREAEYAAAKKAEQDAEPKKEEPNKGVAESAANPAQQAAIAVNMKKQGKKPKHVDEVDYGQGQRKYKAKPAGTIQDESSIMKGLTT